jgi:sugar transferase (PEP-CTERM/EpsH1 system associated)
MKRLVRQTLAEREIDVIFVYSSTMAQYAPSEYQARTIVDLVDVDSEKWRDFAGRIRPPKSWLYKSEWKRLRRYEHAIASRYAFTVLTTEREAALLDELDEFTRRGRLRLISNGVDLEYFRPDERILKSSPPRLVFTGAMDYYANVDGVRWFVDEIFPLIHAEVPEVELLIVGGNPTAEVKKLGRREAVTVTGYVDDVRPYLLNATACVVPLRIARGVQNKVLEAMATGKAVIATPEAVAGLRVQPDLHLLLANNPAEFAQATLAVMRDEELSANLGFEARRFVEAEHAWEPFLERLNKLVETVVARRPTDADTKPRPLARGSF